MQRSSIFILIIERLSDVEWNSNGLVKRDSVYVRIRYSL